MTLKQAKACSDEELLLIYAIHKYTKQKELKVIQEERLVAISKEFQSNDYNNKFKFDINADELKEFTYNLFVGVSELSPFVGKCYRSVNLTEQDLQLYEENNVICWPQFSSALKSYNQSKFRQRNTIFIIESKESRDMSEFTTFFREVLFLPFSTFLVKSKKKINGKNVIVLEEEKLSMKNLILELLKEFQTQEITKKFKLFNLKNDLQTLLLLSIVLKNVQSELLNQLFQKSFKKNIDQLIDLKNQKIKQRAIQQEEEQKKQKIPLKQNQMSQEIQQQITEKKQNQKQITIKAESEGNSGSTFEININCQKTGENDLSLLAKILNIDLNGQEKDFRLKFRKFEFSTTTFGFEQVQEIELQIFKDMLNEGEFKAVYRCEDMNGKQNNQWVLKVAKKDIDCMEIPFEVIKQEMARIVSEYFNKTTQQVYPNTTLFIRYLQPFLVKVESQVKLSNEDHVLFMAEEFVKKEGFTYFNRPWGVPFQGQTEFGEVRLPQTFSHWSKIATNGKFMITDVQGWKVGVGQYVVTDPFLFSQANLFSHNRDNEKGKLDWGHEGMEDWMKKHKCSEVCQRFIDTQNMKMNEELVDRLEDLGQKFARMHEEVGDKVSSIMGQTVKLIDIETYLIDLLAL